MTEQHDFARPRTAPKQRKPAAPRTTTSQHGLAQPLAELAPNLEEPWLKEDTDTPDRTVIYTHPESHRIGLRLQPGDLIIQTWLTAGPDLPPIPAGTAEEKAEAQAANDARLQPGRSWHRTIPLRQTNDLPTTLGAVLRDDLIPALTTKPKRVHAVTYTTVPKPQPESESNAPAKPRRATTKTEGTQK
jgi:hypothetical protein